MHVLRLIAVLAVVATPVLAQDMPEYRDDRSTPQSLIESYYNAINRHEYARAYTYYGGSEEVGSYADFAKGFDTTASVVLLTGSVTAEGGMSKVYAGVPVAIDSIDTDGTHTQYAGCYLTVLVEPTVQEPPVQSMRIVWGKLVQVDGEPAELLPKACPAE